MTDLMQGFDMIASITQAAVNTQAYEVYTAKNDDGEDIIDKNIDITLGDSGVEFKGTLGSSDGSGPWYDFSVPGNSRAIYFMLPITNGSMSYWKIEDGTPKKETIPFTDLVWAFQVDLDFVEMEQQDIKTQNNIPPVVKKHLTDFDESMFSIRALMTDFENANLANYDPERSKIPEALKTTSGLANVSSALTSYFKLLKGSKNPFILGYNIVSKSPGSNNKLKPTFVPTGSTFSTFSDATTSDLNALNFLLMTDNVPPPGGDAGVFTAPWADSTDYEGRFVLGQKLLFTDWLIPTVRNAFGMRYVKRDGNGWLVTSVTDYKHLYKDAIQCLLSKVDLHVHITGHISANITHSNPSPSEAQFKIAGKMYRKVDNKYQCGFDSTVWATLEQPYAVTATITSGSNGEFSVKYEQDIPPATVKKGGNWVGDLDSFFGGTENFVKTEVSNLKNEMSSLTDYLNLSLKNLNSNFIMPGGAVFFFKNPQFNDEGDLLAEINYKTN